MLVLFPVKGAMKCIGSRKS
ncbi:hypothetical protein A2U01_0104269, partial [Trifolium medium]|nr:hypothetical protein [Trifolium medium]